ncbi:carbamoyltransferase family protein [Candidatus Fonsibacter ubiquis]|uniref:carbamoyltransferase family protein n=1 Tax=Candidatus Fonsibacter ubiquis TaxID=1925548 RepID=UPI000C06CBC5|nr:carbamoyltransferase [Candidatus Fonsibacter ubiquis]
MTSVLGISAFYHDSAAAIIVDGKIIAAAQEERFTRKKHDASYPKHAINYVLKEAGLKLSEVDHVVFYEKPFLKFERLLETYVGFSPSGFKSFSKSMPLWLSEKLFQKKMLFDALKEQDSNFNDIKKINFSEHHLSHAASAFFSSPYDEAIILTLDGVGEWATTTISLGKNNKISILKEIHFPHSLGLLYSAFTYFLGFKVNSGEYKVMGLAPYGVPKFKDIILDKLIDVKEDGSFRLNMDYFNYATGLTMTNSKFAKLFKIERREPENNLSQVHMDIAASIQAATEEIVLKITRFLSKEYKLENLCMAGGVALNCVANGKILKESLFKNIWIQPASGDAGGALGAAQAFYYQELNNKRQILKTDSMNGSYLGPQFTENQVENELKSCGANYKKLTLDQIINDTAKALSEEKAVGWFQGRMEFGPRSLGNRSIIADPRSENMQKNLNLKVKYRESFRPFAPAVLFEKVSEWFEINSESPYMLLVADVKKSKQLEMTNEQKNLFGIDKLNVKRSSIPSVTHVDYSARIQTVHKETNPIFYKLIEEFEKITKYPILVNTSFNVRGEPIVCTATDAFNCFMGTDLDVLVCNNFILYKNDQDRDLIKDYKNKYELD